MLITTGVLLPFLQVPSFSQFSGLAAVCTFVALYGTFVYLGEIVANGKYSNTCYDSFTTATMMANICNMAFTYSGHGTFPEQIREMKNPADFGKAFNVLYAVAIPFYTLCAFVAFWAFGNMNSANYWENVRDDAWVEVCVDGVCVCVSLSLCVCG